MAINWIVLTPSVIHKNTICLLPNPETEDAGPEVLKELVLLQRAASGNQQEPVRM